MTYFHGLTAARPFMHDAAYTDFKHIDGTVTLRQFLAGFLSYYPFWIRALYGIRAGFVRLLGMKQPRMALPNLTPADINFEPGSDGTIFTVKDGQDDRYWIAGITEKHLTAHVMVAVEPLDGQRRRFHVGTVVHYHHWTGPVYFTVVRPFHHIVVRQMIKAGVSYAE